MKVCFNGHVHVGPGVDQVTEVTSPDDHSFQDLSSANTATGIASPDDLSFQGLHRAYPILEDNDQVKRSYTHRFLMLGQLGQQLLVVICCFALIPAVSSLSLKSSLDGSLACSGQEVHFVCTTNSPLVSWSSTEYIGPRGIRIEFSAALDSVGTKVTMMGAEAMLLGVNGDNVTSSKLIITVSQGASVTCDDGIQSVTSTFEVPDTPGVPRNIRAVNMSVFPDDSVILLRWDPPMNVVASSISHYVVDFEAGTSTIPPQLNIIALNCNLNTTIVIRAVDVCGREGAGTSSVLADVLQEIGDITEPPNQTTTVSQPDASTCTCEDSARPWKAAFSVTCTIGIVIVIVIITTGIILSWYYQKRSKKFEDAAENEYSMTV